jgi:hypothetical protein
MLDENIGHIKNIKYDPDTKDMEVILVVTNNKFKKKLLRDLSLSGRLEINGEQILYTGNKQDNN